MVVLESVFQARQKHAPHAGFKCAVEHVCDILAQPEILPLCTKMLVRWPSCQTTAGIAINPWPGFRSYVVSVSCR